MANVSHRLAQLAGYMPAVPTAFDRDGEIDCAAFERYCDRQIEEGAAALVVCGTTGEAPTLTRAEHDILVRIAVDVAGGRVPIIAGAGANSTAHAIELAQDAELAKADTILSVVPYYNKPTQRGLHAHFRAIAEATSLPMLLYDVPSRSACGLADETVARLAEHPRIVGLKDATGDAARPLRLRALLGSNFKLFSGDDASALAFILQGGDGCISVTSNLAPALCRRIFLACARGQLPDARRLAGLVARLTAVLFRESNPTPLKYALSLRHLMSSAVRLPLVEPSEQTRREIEAVMAGFAPSDLISANIERAQDGGICAIASRRTSPG